MVHCTLNLEARKCFVLDQIRACCSTGFSRIKHEHIRSSPRVMMLWQQKEVTYLEEAHSFAIICTPPTYGTNTKRVFLIYFKSKKIINRKAALTFFVCFMLICAIMKVLITVQLVLVSWMRHCSPRNICANVMLNTEETQKNHFNLSE